MIKNVKLEKILTVVCCAAVCVLLIAGFAVPKEVRVITDNSVETAEKVYKTT